MTPHHGDNLTSEEEAIRISRHLSRLDILNGKRQRNTDILSSVKSDGQQNVRNARQPDPIRDENLRLRRELDVLQRRLAQEHAAKVQLEQEIETIHHGHRLAIEQYQNSLREMMEELNQKQNALQELDRHYQELEQSFHITVEAETRKLLDEAAQTMEHSPGYTPPILHGVMRTLELQLKRTEDQHVAEIMALMRQAQRKNDLLEQELAQERENTAQERQQLQVQRHKLIEQSKARQQFIAASLSARFTGLVAIVSTVLLVICIFIQITLFEYFKIPLYWALFSPILLCALLALVFARMGSRPGKGKQ